MNKSLIIEPTLATGKIAKTQATVTLPYLINNTPCDISIDRRNNNLQML